MRWRHLLVAVRIRRPLDLPWRRRWPASASSWHWQAGWLPQCGRRAPGRRQPAPLVGLDGRSRLAPRGRGGRASCSPWTAALAPTLALRRDRTPLGSVALGQGPPWELLLPVLVCALRGAGRRAMPAAARPLRASALPGYAFISSRNGLFTGPAPARHSRS
ncbi:hypothetical protein ACRAWF_08005 [Streptomyces sp. L7]